MAVERALTARWPDAAVERLTRTSAGDRDPGAALTAFADKGAFTADLSDALLRGEADIVVHSWKDLPTEGRSGTTIAGTLERADPRDLLLVRPGLRSSRVDRLTVLSSSPRRAWLAAGTLPGLLPWPVRDVQTTPVRGNVPTRVRKLLDGDADALLVAKAAVDRLLDPDGPAEAASAAGALRAALDMCDWMVLPVRSWPAAPAQGALAFEICRGREDLSAMLRAVGHEPTREAVERERAVLAAHGGGCHAALGATAVRSRPQRAQPHGRRRTGTLGARPAPRTGRGSGQWGHLAPTRRTTRHRTPSAASAARAAAHRRPVGEQGRRAARRLEHDPLRVGRGRTHVAPAGRPRRVGARLRRRTG
jgi:hydroxymethylbilane synthase